MAVRKSVRSVRTDDASWLAARSRAEKEGLSMSHIVNELVDGYARGEFHMPKPLKDYSGTVTPPKPRAKSAAKSVATA